MNETKTTAPAAGNGGGAARFSSPAFIWPAALGLAVLLYFGIGYVADIFTHESTDDAFIAGHITSIAPRIAGQAIAVPVLDNQMVRSNDLLVEIDPGDYALTLAQKKAAAESQNANYRTMWAGYELMQTKVATASSRPVNPRRTPMRPNPARALPRPISIGPRISWRKRPPRSRNLTMPRRPTPKRRRISNRRRKWWRRTIPRWRRPSAR